MLEDFRAGLRTVGYLKWLPIAYALLDESVAIVGIFYGGRHHERILRGTDWAASGPRVMRDAPGFYECSKWVPDASWGVNMGVNK